MKYVALRETSSLCSEVVIPQSAAPTLGARLVGPILTLQDQLCNARPATVTTVIVPSPLLEKLSDRKKIITGNQFF